MLADSLNQKQFLAIKNGILKLMRIIVIMIKMIIVIHFVTCAWLTLSQFGFDECHDILLNKFDTLEASTSQLYYSQFYLIVATMSTVGYGENLPNINNDSNDQRLFLFTII